MCPSKIDRERVDLLLRAFMAGINHFYWEGHEIWSKADAAGELRGEFDLDDPYIQAEFWKREDQGNINLLGAEDRYMEVLKPFPKGVDQES